MAYTNKARLFSTIIIIAFSFGLTFGILLSKKLFEVNSDIPTTINSKIEDIVLNDGSLIINGSVYTLAGIRHSPASGFQQNGHEDHLIYTNKYNIIDMQLKP